VGVLVCICGLLGVFCSVMVYRDTHRPLWDNCGTTFKFLMTTFILGVVGILWTSIIASAFYPKLSVILTAHVLGSPCAGALIVMSTFKMIVEAMIFMHLKDAQPTALKKSAMLMTQQLYKPTAWRFICGSIGGIILPGVLLTVKDMTPAGVLGIVTGIMVLTLAGEGLERYLFFRAVVPLKMPGSRNV